MSWRVYNSVYMFVGCRVINMVREDSVDYYAKVINKLSSFASDT